MYVSEILLEELMEKRAFYLYTLKHLEFKSIDDENSTETQKLTAITIQELKKVETAIHELMDKNSS